MKFILLIFKGENGHKQRGVKEVSPTAVSAVTCPGKGQITPKISLCSNERRLKNIMSTSCPIGIQERTMHISINNKTKS